jgi:P pilus assembly chaperone PapD
MKRCLLLLAVLWSGQVSAQTVYLEKKEYAARNQTARVKLQVSHSRSEPVNITVRVKGPTSDPTKAGEVLSEGVTLMPSSFKLAPNKMKKLMLTLATNVTQKTPYFVCALYIPPVERKEGQGGGSTSGSALLATESCSRFWVTP